MQDKARLGMVNHQRIDCYIGLDLGTSGCRALAIDHQGGEIAAAATDLPAPLHDADGRSEQEPALWWEAVLAVLADLASRLRDRRPRALALDATATSLLLADPAGGPLAPALMYDDGRALAQTARVDAVAPPDSPARGASSSLCKLLYLRETLRPPRGTLALHQADWICGRLCGRFGTSDWNNSLRLGYDPAAEAWPTWLADLGLGDIRLPRVTAPGSPVGTLAAAVASATGLPADLGIRAGTTDSTASVLAAGAAHPGDGVTVLGSTLVVKLVSDRPIWAPEYGIYSHRLGALWLAGGASNSGGAVLRKLFSDRAIQDLSARLRPDEPTGLDYYPLSRPGERFPLNDPELRPRLQPRPADQREFFQGLLEGMARIETRGYALLRELGAPTLQRVIGIGGGAANAGWRRIRERALGVPVTTAVHAQAAYGAALLAARPHPPNCRLEPDPD
jgi:sugar (pentulose or hexulose) kinase